MACRMWLAFVSTVLLFAVSSPAIAQPRTGGPVATSPTKPGASTQIGCSDKTLTAHVVAIDHPMVFNRIGAQNVNWMMYALRHDVIERSSAYPLDYTKQGETLFASVKEKSNSRGIALRPDLRPRPLVLRVAAGEYLLVRFTNLLELKNLQPGGSGSTNSGPFNSEPDPLPGVDHPLEHAAKDAPGGDVIYNIDDQVASRSVGFHPQGLEPAPFIDSDSSYVGGNADSLVKPGESRDYCFHAPAEGAFLVSNPGAAFGGEGSAGNSGVGLFGTIAVQPRGASFYRAQVTEEEMRLATKGTTPTGQPIIDYEALYPNDCAQNGIWCREGKAGQPILNMVAQGDRIATFEEIYYPRRLAHADTNAIVMGTGSDGRFSADTYPLEKAGRRNPSLPNRLEPFREFVSVYHDENAATQAFPYFFEHPELGHTLHGVRDAFMINYGSGGIGAEIIANRLQAGPMQDCIDCAYEEFFLSSFAVGDPAMLVDRPVNLAIGRCQPEFVEARKRKELGQSYDQSHEDGFQKHCDWKGMGAAAIAQKAYYPHDPANVHHSYIGDFVKFRNVHAGKEQHVFHLHNHQWLFNPNDDNSNYIDAQGVGPGSGYTYEIAFGGSGNRNKTVGDAVFHCHFYPHFAQGMWYMWRNHDVMETGTPLAVSQTGSLYHDKPYALMDGEPASKARALPDGEIVAGTPIPAVVPLPGKALPPMPAAVSVAPKQTGLGSKAVLDGVFDSKTTNPGYPFWIAGVTEHSRWSSSIGHRPTTPPLDMSASAGGFDGGLPRHALAGYAEGGKDESKLTRLTAEKHLKQTKPIYFDETGTDLEKVAMKFHATREHPSHRYDRNGVTSAAAFVVNGAPAVPGAPYNEPCIDDRGKLLTAGDASGEFFGGATFDAMIKVGDALPGGIQYGAKNPRVYKGANIQLDVVFNKVGYHYPQQRILTLWDDVVPTLDNKRPPEPLVLRMNTFDCAMYQHTNLVPKDFYADDYQITTPTDVIGQHIHLPKWDLTSADGSANGWNYEDGTFSPGAVRERVYAINQWNAAQAKAGKPVVPKPDGSTTPLVPEPHPYFGALSGHQLADCRAKWLSVGGDFESFEKNWGAYPKACDWLGARTTLQRWFSDPLINAAGVHRGLGITFTHDHLGPSTHQQLGLYATMLTEPPGSEWRHNETGVLLGSRKAGALFGANSDGGPTSWQATITGPKSGRIDVDKDGRDDAHREFFLQFGDFQHAYQKGVYVGVTAKGVPYKYDASATVGPQHYRQAIHPSVRKPASTVRDIVKYDSHCPGGEGSQTLPGAVYSAQGKVPRPCPEAISADDVGMMVVNYRNEPVGARVYDPNSKSQAAGYAGDLSYAFQTRTDRRWSDLNSQLGSTPYPALTNHVLKGDPFTPIMRAYSGDLIRVKVQAGSHEHEHNATINGLTWLQGGSGFGQAPHSGWRGSQNAGLSEQFTFATRITDYATINNLTDRLYAIDSSQDGLWSGVWGVLRSGNRRDSRSDVLHTLPSNPRPTLLRPGLGLVRYNDCPSDAPLRIYRVAAVLANQALDKPSGTSFPSGGASGLNGSGGTLVYNPRTTAITIAAVDEKGNPTGLRHSYGTGPLHDPTAVMFVREEDLDARGKLRAGVPVEPLVLRAGAGECVQVVLSNRLPRNRLLRSTSPMPDLDGYSSLSGIVPRDPGSATSDMTTFNNNHLRPSNRIGLHPQMVHYDVQAYDGSAVGVNKTSLAEPGTSYVYQWYAGQLETVASAEQCPAEALSADYAELSVFPENPTLRPLNQIYDAPAFDRIASSLIADTVSSESRSISPEAPEVSKVSAELRALPSVAACLETVPSAETAAKMGASRDDEQLASIESLRDPSGSAAVADDPIDEAPLIVDPQAKAQLVYDRSARLQARQTCVGAQVGRDMQASIYDHLVKDSDAAELLQPPPAERQSLGTAQAQATAPETLESRAQALSQKLTASFLYQLPEADDDGDFAAAFAWRDEVYPALSADTTRLAALGGRCRFVPVEFGGSNLSPPDRIKQGQKAAVGALIVEPQGSRWSEYRDDAAIDRQNPGATQQNRRATRASATVTYPVTGGLRPIYRGMRDMAIVHQKGLNFRYAKGDAVANLAAEREDLQSPNLTAPEDAHDSGHMAINYGSEPLWFRFGLAPDAPFGRLGFGGVDHAWQAFSNQCCDNGGSAATAQTSVGEPYVPIMLTSPGAETRLRVLMPTGVGRATTFSQHGHAWPRDPYLAENVDAARLPVGGSANTWGIAAKCIGDNPLQMALGGQESVSPMAHFDVVLASAGGKDRTTGDFLWRDMGGFGISNGLWGVLRVSEKSKLQSALPLRESCL
ncbi:hypothetical protein [Lysobacter sp. Root604]|uniref:hypothetical protein n=1 Tax=Lysobacter sp. Root604 TaxID=1736568 RepID=UPI000A664FFB|nr:hypothetical protein [Lysobacter sp. Root604]